MSLMSHFIQWLHFLLLGCLILLGALFLFPKQPRSGIFFGVSVPVGFSHTAEGRSIRRRYQMRSAPIQMLALFAGVLLVFYPDGAWFPLTILGIILGQLACSVILWTFTTRKVRAYAIHPPLVRTASLARQPHMNVTWIGYAAAALPLLLATLYIHAHWAQIPDVFPIHWDIQGQPNRWTYKSTLSVYGMVGLGSVLLLFILLIDKLLPCTSGKDRKLSSIALSGCAGFITLILTFSALMPFRNTTAGWKILSSSAVVMVLVLALEITSIWAGPKTVREPYDGTLDACWYGSLFYYNRKDPALMVPKRFGSGYTLNFGRPTAWWMMAIVILLPILFSVVIASHK